MPKKPVNLEAIKRLDAQLDALLRAHPELREPNPEREAALYEFLETLEQEDISHD